ncbi:hypothetical protein CC1G_08518 [Coprinopsis cinerea okayama7|uniref:HCNGP-domain-containing protein n=1 Tax=Coprinopsis cinerea (strain Okayama-7 / 130 / ATCC MYA-4618 / FGSC 9003) TaxID=240176 RepID=A8ND37_COPC7|nr:hypothetical protein CC1G_08518 [Coprinopsis cinerea okayama7\|eukprot:XP_001832690.1 hypothetical protein CC1G_08518 [Coprinopsis cinerea okayama7\
MRGLLAYADDDSDSESTIQVPQNSRKHHDIENGSSVAGTTSKEKEHSNNHHKSKAGSSKLFASDGRAAQVVIRRPPTLRERPRAHISADDSTNSPRGQSSSIRSSSQPHDSGSPSHLSTSNEGTPAPHGGEIDTEQQQLARMRALLRPPPIPGLEDWGIPPPSTDPVDPQIAAKLANFHALKHPPPGSSNQPKHFNDSLMSNRSFRNPHLYSTLLDWTGMSEEDEKTTNFPKEIWDLDEIKNKKEWYADNVGAWLRNGLNTGTS